MKVSVGTTPYIASDGAIASLIGIAERSKIKLSGNGPASISPGSTPLMNATTMTLDAVASMGFGSMLDINVAADAQYSLLELFVREPPVAGAPGGIVVDETYGISIRICIKAWGFDAQAAANLGVVAAKASAAAAYVSYQVDVIGLDTSDIVSLPGLITGSIGPFDVTKLQTVGAVFSDLSTFVGTYPEKCHPELLAVSIELNDVPMPFGLSSSAIYALGRISSGYNYIDAVAKLPEVPAGVPPIDKAFVQALYLAAVDSDTKPPNTSQQELARNVLAVGIRNK